VSLKQRSEEVSIHIHSEVYLNKGGASCVVSHCLCWRQACFNPSYVSRVAGVGNKIYGSGVLKYSLMNVDTSSPFFLFKFTWG